MNTYEKMVKDDATILEELQAIDPNMVSVHGDGVYLTIVTPTDLSVDQQTQILAYKQFRIIKD